MRLSLTKILSCRVTPTNNRWFGGSWSTTNLTASLQAASVRKQAMRARWAGAPHGPSAGRARNKEAKNLPLADICGADATAVNQVAIIRTAAQPSAAIPAPEYAPDRFQTSGSKMIARTIAPAMRSEEHTSA